MTDSAYSTEFTLEDVKQAAGVILNTHPDAIVAHRLLREVLRLPPGDRELALAEKAALESQWVHQLESAQLPDGSFGRFHTQDTKVKTVFRTTEEALDRAVALGLTCEVGVVSRVQAYILDALRGKAHLTDWREKNDAFPVLIKFIVAGRLAQLDPLDKNLSLFWVYLEEIAERAFASGQYSAEEEIAAYLALSGIHVKRGFLHSQHALWILSARRLPDEVDRAVDDWIWHKPDGIVAGRLAQLDPLDKNLSLFWVYLEEIAERAFASGQYSLEEEIAAYLALSGIHVKRGFLHSQHALWILSARRLPDEVDRAVVDWIWHKPDGIGYLGAPLTEINTHTIGYWFRSMNLLSRFASWRELCTGTLNRLWELRNEAGLWDFGAEVARCADFPLSDNWRNRGSRSHDYSTYVLSLLRKAFD